MNDERRTNSLYDYSDKSVTHAGYAALVYGAVSLVSGLLALLRFFLYRQPGNPGITNREFVNEQWLQQPPLLVAITVVYCVVIAAISGGLAFGIFRRNRFAIVAMIGLIVVLQLYTWFVAGSIAGTLVSIVVVAFLARGARRIFQEHAERTEQ